MPTSGFSCTTTSLPTSRQAVCPPTGWLAGMMMIDLCFPLLGLPLGLPRLLLCVRGRRRVRRRGVRPRRLLRLLCPRGRHQCIVVCDTMID